MHIFYQKCKKLTVVSLTPWTSIGVRIEQSLFVFFKAAYYKNSIMPVISNIISPEYIIIDGKRESFLSRFSSIAARTLLSELGTIFLSPPETHGWNPKLLEQHPPIQESPAFRDKIFVIHQSPAHDKLGHWFLLYMPP